MPRILLCLVLGLLLPPLASCGGESCKISSGLFSGLVNGQPWAFVSGSVRLGHLAAGQMGIAFFNEPVIMELAQCEPTNGGRSSARNAQVVAGWNATSLQVGTHDVELSVCQSTDCGPRTAGQLRIEEVSAEWVVGAACAGEKDAPTRLSGNFSVVNCTK